MRILLRLEVKQMPEGGHHVPGLVEAKVQCMEEVWEVLQTGSSARTIGSTRSNDLSSRSHWSNFSFLLLSLNSKCFASSGFPPFGFL
jgi:hypothetical protein